MDLEIGSILEGKVTGIMKFGAFVALPDGRSGLVHISEIANTYVNDVNEYLSVGQTVRVKYLGVNEGGKINLSIKQTLPTEAPRGERRRAPSAGGNSSARMRTAPTDAASAAQGAVYESSGDSGFEDKLRHFMQESDSRMSGNKLYADRRTATRRRK